MALDVEDGTGKATSESYASVAEADNYLTARGMTLWATLSTTEKENALRRATDYMPKYEWKGVRVTTTQALDWPRLYASAYGFEIAQDNLPTKVKQACIELAFRAAFGPLSVDVRVDDTGRVPTKIIEKVGPIDTETTYATRGQVSVPSGHRFPAVDLLLREYTHSNSIVYR